MAQQLKDEVEGRIRAAALELFAREGYRRATVAGIARLAKISTGNVYRYHRGKRDLFETVVPAALASELRKLVHHRVRALEGVSDVTTQGPGTAYHQFTEELIAFAVRKRLEVIILLSKSEGTVHERYAAALRRDLERLALEHFAGEAPRARKDPHMRSTLERVYRSWLQTLVAILEASGEERAIRAAVDRFSAYHLAGLKGLFTAARPNMDIA